ncbi:hypothetical protein L1987_70303 [Smallanthus sonchifolius]|uniref:Uncharacterized protein n=1 Tax=Smallanthus sonchifolius TaxID=185202 RepID=A0ACB9AQ39_9ASTR|nr:hypothetical protein L1987_70303 [Smallanthus sonchifolius]
MAVEPNGKSLKDALCAQQQLLQKLYHELDVEREAAATAASEAMSMILRLQGEKAAVKMEAEQYKRLAEEKMNHAEESMETFDEIMCQKEMEIASLDYQVQAYRYKLLSLGFDDLGVHEVKFPEYLLQRNESLTGETSARTPPKRLALPNLNKGLLERDRSITDDSDMIAKVVEESLRDDEHNHNFDLGIKTESSCVDISSYLEQIRELDKVVEHMVGDQYQCSASAKTSRCSSIPSKLNELDLAPSIQKSTDEKISSDACSPSVCDVFEVPLIEETLYKDEGKSSFKDEGKSSFEDDSKSIFKDEGKTVFKDEGKTFFKDEGKSVFKDDEKVKKLTSFPRLPARPYHKDEKDSGKKVIFSKHKVKRLTSLPQLPGIGADFHLALAQPNTTTKINDGDTGTVEQNVGQERVTSREERQLRLLYEINEKLNSIQSEIRSRITEVNESSSNYDLPMLHLREVY